MKRILSWSTTQVLKALCLALICVAVIAFAVSVSPVNSLAKSRVQTADASPSAGCNAQPSVPGNDEMSLKSGGSERTFRLNLPRQYDGATPLPLILGFHGRGSDGAEFQNFTGLTFLPAVSVFPDGTFVDGKRTWQGAPYSGDADDVQFVSDLLTYIKTNYCVDKSRVLAAGKSNGGGLVALLACRLPEEFTAFAPVAGAYYPQSFADCGDREPTSIVAIHGIADATMHYDGGHRQGVDYPGVREWIHPWVDAADCKSSKAKPVGKKHEKVDRIRWKECRDNVDIELYSVSNGGHVWPGELMYSGGGYVTEEFSATEVIWDFLQNHPKQ